MTSRLALPLVGSRSPRVEIRPSGIVASYGQEALELGERAGIIADPWQADGVELMLSVRADGKWAASEHGEIVPRQNGKSAEFEIRVLAGFFLLGERLILWSAHEVKTALENQERILTAIARLGRQISDTLYDVDGIPVQVINKNGFEGFRRLDTRQRIRFVARSKGSGRGFSGDVNIIDEAFAYTGAQQAALAPSQSARPNPQTIYGSSPPLDGQSGEVLYRLRARAAAILHRNGDHSLCDPATCGAADTVTLSHVVCDNDPENTSFAWRQWGLPGTLDQIDKVDRYDRRLWAYGNPALGVRRADGSGLSEEYIASSEVDSMSPEDFGRERLGIWPRQQESAGGLIDPQRWRDLRDSDSRRVGAVALGVDIERERDWASISLYGQREDGLGHAQLIDYRAGVDWIIPRLVELRDALDLIGIAMARGTFASLAADLAAAGFEEPEDRGRPVRGNVHVLSAVEMAAACGQIIDATRQGSMRVVPSEALDTAVMGASTRQTGDTIAWARRDPRKPGETRVSVSPIVSLTEARWLYQTWLPIVVEDDYDLLESFY